MSDSGKGSDSRPIELAYRYSPANPKPFFVPQDWQEARVYLQAGNEALGRYFDACRRGHFEPGEQAPVIEMSHAAALGEPKGDDGLPIQQPYAVVFGCSDARAPTEILFGQEFNDLFNIRVAGNVLTRSGAGSLLFALKSFVQDDPKRLRSLKLVVALGHRGCGAIKGAVAAYQASDGSQGPADADDPLGNLLQKIIDLPLALSANAFDEVRGHGASRDQAHASAIAELTVYMNAAWTAYQIREIVESMGPEVADRVGVVYGVFDPGDLRVHSRPDHAEDPEGGLLDEPPRDLAGLGDLALIVARGLWPHHPRLS